MFYLVCAAWLILVALALSGNGTLIRHDRLIQGGPPLWLATLVFLAGWQVMLWAMMVSASLGAIEARVGLRAKSLFLTGYLAVWTLFGLLSFFFDVGVHATVSHAPWLALHPWLIAGGILVLAGTYQLSDLKNTSLAACRLVIHASHPGTSSQQDLLRTGGEYGVKCLGSSWALMLLAFALGAGSIAIMAAIAGLMVWEAGAPLALKTVNIAGYSLITIGVIVLAGPIFGPLWIS